MAYKTDISKEMLIPQIIKLYSELKSYMAVGRELNIDRRTVKKYIDQVNNKEYLIVNEDNEDSLLIPFIYNNNELLDQLVVDYGNDIRYQRDDYFDENVFELIQTEEQAYFLGMLYADGNIKTKNNKLVLSLNVDDIDIIYKFHQFMKGTKDINIKKASHNDGYMNRKNTAEVSYGGSPKLKNDLIKLGCLPAKTHKLKCPNKQQVPVEFFKDFMRGYIDGDGCLSFSHSDFAYPHLSLLGTYNFLRGAQIRMRWDLSKEPYKTKDNIYNFSISDSELAIKYMTELYENSTIYLDRKFQRFAQLKEAYLSRIK